MKGQKVMFFSLYSTRVAKKNSLEELYLKLFRKKEYYQYLRSLARQRMEDKLFFKQLKKSLNYEKIYKKIDFKTLVEGL